MDESDPNYVWLHSKTGNDDLAKSASLTIPSVPVETSLLLQMINQASEGSSEITERTPKKSRESEPTEPAKESETIDNSRTVAVIAFRQHQVISPTSGITITKRRLLVLQWIDEDRASKFLLKYCEDRIRVKQCDKTVGTTTGGLLSGEDNQRPDTIAEKSNAAVGASAV
jgi:hypothetical protein